MVPPARPSVGRTVLLVLSLTVLLAAVSPAPAFALQLDELELTIDRTFGYRAGDQIQGRFTLGVDGPADLQRVQFLIDGQVVAQISQRPFEYRFSTGDYPLGRHELAAVGLTLAGRELRSPMRSFEFVSADDSLQGVADIAVPLVAVILVVAALATLGPTLLGRKRKFVLGVYGAAGGAVCPRCRKPYSRGVLSPNLVVGKLERCPHCGKWAIVRRATSAELETAEQLIGEQSDRGRAVPQPQDDLRRAIEDSKFED